MPEEKRPENPRQHGYPDSGDVSGKGRERRADTEVFAPEKQTRAGDEFGTHGGTRKHKEKERQAQAEKNPPGYEPPANPEQDISSFPADLPGSRTR